MSVIYLEHNGVLAIPISKIGGVGWQEESKMLQIQVGYLCHSIYFDNADDGLEKYSYITAAIERFYK